MFTVSICLRTGAVLVLKESATSAAAIESSIKAELARPDPGFRITFQKAVISVPRDQVLGYCIDGE